MTDVTIYGDESGSHIRVFRYAFPFDGATFGAFYIGRTSTRSFSTHETGKGATRDAAVVDLWRQLHGQGAVK